jgi:hypothetical protein
MRRATCAVNVEIWEDSLYYRKNNKIAQCDVEPVSQLSGEAKSI